MPKDGIDSTTPKPLPKLPRDHYCSHNAVILEYRAFVNELPPTPVSKRGPWYQYLLIRILALLNAALLQRIVVAEEVTQQVPQDSSLEQVRLQPVIQGKGANTLYSQSSDSWYVLGEEKQFP